MEKYPLTGIICYVLLRIGASVTTEESEINESILDLLDKENPNFDKLLSEAKKYGIDADQYETPVYIDKKDNLCLNVRVMKGNDTKLAINKEIQRLYVQVPSKHIFPTNEEMINYLASVLNISRDSLYVADSFANKRTIVLSHLQSSDVVDRIVTAASGNYLSEDGNTILSVSTDEIRKLIRDKHITLPPDFHKIKEIDKRDVEMLSKMFGMEPPPSAPTRKSENNKTDKSQTNKVYNIREDNSEKISKVSEIKDLNTESELEKATREVTKSLEILPTQTYTKVMKNKVTKYSYKRTKLPKTKGPKKEKRKTVSKIVSRKTIRKKSKTVNEKPTKINVNGKNNVEKLDTESVDDNLNTETETEEATKTLKIPSKKVAKKRKRKTKAEMGKSKTGAGKTKTKPKLKGKLKKTKTIRSKPKVKAKTKKAKLKTKTIKPKIKKKVIKGKYIPVIQDAQDNVIIKVKVRRGDSNKLLKIENRHETKVATVNVQIQAPMYQEAFENEMSRYMSQVLGISRSDIKLSIGRNQNIKEVLIPKQKLEIKVVKRKLKDAFNNIHKFSLIQ